MRILNLYAGIGGNRKLWDKEHLGFDVEVTAIELNPQIAKIYQDFFPRDKVIIADAHQYLLEHFKEYEFIWSSPPCQSHSRINIANCLSPYKDNSKQIKHGGGIPIRYPDLKLYEEIILLKHFYKGKYCVENVIPYYQVLMDCISIHRHCIWSNFKISPLKLPRDLINKDGDKNRGKRLGFDIRKYKIAERKDTILRNCVNPELGLHILNESKRNIQPELFK